VLLFRVGFTLIAFLLASGTILGQTQQEPEPEEEEEEEKPKFARIYWDEGVRIEGTQKNFTVFIGGMAQNDSAAFSVQDDSEGELGRLENGVEWRRARVFAEGVFARYFDYKFMYDVASNNPPRLKDAFVTFRFPFAPVRVQGGRFRTRLSLEGGTSAQDTTFMERGLLSAFVPVRNSGFQFLGDRQELESSLWWSVGLVQNETQFDIRAKESFGFSGRLAYAFRKQETLDVVHLGASILSRPVQDSIRFLERPESHIAKEFVDTGDIAAEASNTMILEAAMVRGSFSVQSEYGGTFVNASEGQNPSFHSFYVYGSYFLTGESRRYDSERAAFGTVLPRKPFTDFQDSVGAVEVAFRYSHLDLNDKSVEGGVLNDFTLALNWYANDHARVMVNAIRAKREGVEGVWIGQVRLQWAY